MKDCNGECADCKCKSMEYFIKQPIRYYIMYVAKGYVGMGCWESVRKVELLKNATNEKQAIEEAKKWLRGMKKKEHPNFFKLLSAQLVASAHKDILKLV
ncbi:MAG: hypothetical protein AAB621_02540 [Patescibacteria group bacterium]